MKSIALGVVLLVVALNLAEARQPNQDQIPPQSKQQLQKQSENEQYRQPRQALDHENPVQSQQALERQQQELQQQQKRLQQQQQYQQNLQQQQQQLLEQQQRLLEQQDEQSQQLQQFLEQQQRQKQEIEDLQDFCLSMKPGGCIFNPPSGGLND